MLFGLSFTLQVAMILVVGAVIPVAIFCACKMVAQGILIVAMIVRRLGPRRKNMGYNETHDPR